MTAKEYLSQAYKIDYDINSKLEQVASLRDLATKATSTISDMPGSPNRNVHKMEDAIVKIIALEDEINSDIHELISLKADITHMIKRVSREQFLRRVICVLIHGSRYPWIWVTVSSIPLGFMTRL